MAEERYATDLTDAQWKQIEPLIPPPKFGGRPRSTNVRDVLNAAFYITRTGCAWRMLPHDLPPWQTVCDFYSKRRDAGVWKSINARLHEHVRRKAGRPDEPRIAVIDSQSVKTTDRGGNSGFDSGKKGQRPQATLAR